ncbi:MAG: FAD-dependent oxidoreductase [Anaerolineae bacterium]|jgi:NAD(P)H-nitrite reductase large subunit
MRTLIVGAGPAGVTVAETLRQTDQQMEIVMLSHEPFPPYSPPAMLEYFMTDREVHLWRGRDFPGRMNVDYRSGTEVVAVNPQAHHVELRGGATLTYDRLVIATGGRLYTPVEGETKPGVYNFKSLTAATELLGKVRNREVETALVVGAGFIGVEIALLLADLGLEVTQLVRSRAMRSMLDSESSQMVLEMVKKRGVQVRRDENADAVAFVGEPRAKAVEMRSGAVVSADLLVAATGLKPNVAPLTGSGIETNWGALVDDHLRTNVPDVYACGDVAETFDRLTSERYVHAIFPNAVAQGRIVAQNLLGMDVAYEGADHMNSLKHLGLPIMAVGHMKGEEMRQRQGDVLRKLYVSDGHLVGFRLVGDVSAAGILRSLINRQVDVRPFQHLLLDPNFGMGTITEMAIHPV